MIVHKFGGTSVGDAQRFASVADIVMEHHNETSGRAMGETVVVVSAMSGVTSQLIAGARAAADGKDTVYREIKAKLLGRHLKVVQALLNHSPERLEVGKLIEDRLHELERIYRSIAVLGELTARGRDVVTSFGEQLSANILAATLRDRGMRAQAVSATELIVTDDNFGAATPLMDKTRQRLQQQIRPLVERGVIPVITGYIAASEEGVTTTLGRGGGDYTAAIVGAGLNADEVWIWSDVDGILTADPNIVPQAHTLTELSYAEAADLAYFGADVLHPKTIRPVTEGGIPLRIVNSFNPTHPGTLIVETPSLDREVLPAIISTTGLSMIAIGSRDDAASLTGHAASLTGRAASLTGDAASLTTLQMAARALQRLSEVGVDVLMFSQSFSEHSLNLVVREQDQAHCLKVLRREFESGKQDNVCSLGTKEQVATISVVGVPGWNETPSGTVGSIVSHAFSALGKHGTRVIAVAQAATEHSVSFCIPEDQVADTVRFLHHELRLEDENE
jgi:aspartokinase/homoserine dehydrogenase 1